MEMREMKKFVSSLLVLMLCVVLACPVFADKFVPSIGEKDAPEMVGEIELYDQYGNFVTSDHDEHCIVITPVSEAETSTEIPEENKELLLDVYEELSDSNTKLSEVLGVLNDQVEDVLGAGKDADDLVVKDLFDIYICCEELEEHLAEDGNYVELTFDINVEKDTYVGVTVYVDGEWKVVPAVNNGDGTITCKFEEVCPVAFMVPAGGVQTGDVSGGQIGLWCAVCAVSVAAIAALLVVRHKKAQAN